MPQILTIQVVIKNNCPATKVIETAKQLNAKLMIGDINCDQETIMPYIKVGADVVQLSLDNDYSDIRNALIKRTKTEWIMWLEPWEFLAGGQEAIRKAMLGPPDVYSMPTITQDVMVKESRLWHKDTNARFVNPVFETLNCDGKYLEVPVVGKPPDRTEEHLKLLAYWKMADPLGWTPYYFQACMLLSQRKYDEFLTVSDHFLFHEKGVSMPKDMLQYYRALVLCLIKKKTREGIRSLLTCLSQRPMMAEYWCLLGDVYYQQSSYEKAKHFYENALVMGARRLRTDAWPMEISKYKAYPNKMMAACDRILAETRVITARRTE